MNNETELERFRAGVAGWLAENYPRELREAQPGSESAGRPHDDFRAAEQRWHRLRAEQWWLAPTWPQEYGGAGLDRDQARVLAQEQRRVGARPLPISAGLSLLPGALQRGTPQQKLRDLPASPATRWRGIRATASRARARISRF